MEFFAIVWVVGAVTAWMIVLSNKETDRKGRK